MSQNHKVSYVNLFAVNVGGGGGVVLVCGFMTMSFISTGQVGYCISQKLTASSLIHFQAKLLCLVSPRGEGTLNYFSNIIYREKNLVIKLQWY